MKKIEKSHSSNIRSKSHMTSLRKLSPFKEGFNKNIILWIIFATYLLVTGLLVSLHEPWRDEGQAWLIARDLTYGQIFRQTGVEGHFFLWFYVLKSFTSLPFMPTLPTISYCLTAIGSYLLLFKVRFPLWFKCMLLVSPLLIYEYPAISRNYSLSYMLVVALLALHDSRDLCPVFYTFILGLAMNVMVVATALSLILWFFYWYDNLRFRKQLPPSRQKSLNAAFAVGMFFLALAVYQIIWMFMQRSSLGRILQLTPIHALWGSLIVAATGFFIYAAACFGNLSSSLPAYAYRPWHTPLVVFISVVSYIIMDKLFNFPVIIIWGTTLFLVFMKNKYALKLSLICAVLAVISTSYSISIRHSFILYPYLAAVVALFSEIHISSPKKITRWLIITILFIIFSNLNIYTIMLKDISADFSGSVKAAQYIKQQGFDNKSRYFLTTQDHPLVGSIAPFFSEKIFYFEKDGAYGSFTDWIKYYSLSSPQPDIDKLAAGREILRISYYNNLPKEDWLLLASFEGLEESVYFYRKIIAP